jgi:hypothetical protein
VLVDSRVIRNYISLKAVERIGLPHRQKRDLYPLVIILEDLIAYRGGIIYLKTGLIQIVIKGRLIIMSFNILPLGKDKAVLGMP